MAITKVRKVYERPALIEIGTMGEITQTFGWGRGGGHGWGHGWGHGRGHGWGHGGGHGSKGDGYPNSPDS